jgi:pimeloyl-ACP methyl ester carboxylesterase
MQNSIDLNAGTIHYREEGSGEPLLFVHGLLVDGRLWRDVTPALSATGHRCIVPDLPLGSHRVALSAGADRSPRGVARLLAELIERLELDRVVVVANDTGGAIAQLLAAERPELLGGLVLTNCDLFENFLPPLFRPLQWLAHVPGAYRLIATSLRSARLRRSKLAFGMLSHRTIDDELTAAWSEPLREGPIRADVTAVLRAIDSADTIAAAEALARRPLPLLLAWAPDDLAFPLRLAERLAGMVEGARVERVEGSRAFVPIDQPARLAELVDDFTRALSASPLA